MAKIVIDVEDKFRNEVKAYAAENGYKSMKAFIIKAIRDEIIENECEKVSS